MASRLTAVADALRDGDESAMGEFFAEGQPFRDYKSAREFPEGELAIPEQDWQRHCWNPHAVARPSPVSLMRIGYGSVSTRCDGRVAERVPLRTQT